MSLKQRKRPQTKALAKAAVEFCSQRYGIMIPWEFIIGLVDWLMDDCLNSAEQLQAAAQNPSRFQMIMLRWEARKRARRLPDRCCSVNRMAFAVCDAIFTVADETDNKDIEVVFDERP